MPRLRYKLRITRINAHGEKNISGLKKELRKDPYLEAEFKLPPKSKRNDSIVEIRIDVSVQGNNHKQLLERKFKRWDAAIVDVTNIGEETSWDRARHYFKENWKTMCVSYGILVLYTYLSKGSNFTTDYIHSTIVLVIGIPISIATGLPKARFNKIDYTQQ